MASTITNKEKNKLPDWALSTMNQIEDLGFFNWVYDWEYPVPTGDTIQRVQIRDQKNVGPASVVALYAEAMKRGDKFPPGVVTLDGRIVDFNTRARAAAKLGHTTFPVFIIQENYDGADSFTQERFHMLGTAFNSGGPVPLTRPELSAQLRMAAANSDQWDTDAVAKHVHVKRGTVQGIFAEFRAEKRAEKLGVPFNGSVSSTTRAMLGQKSEKLADEPFKQIARLAQDAGMITKDLAGLCKRVVEITTGDTDRLALIATERADREQQIAGFRASGKRRPPLSSRMRTDAKFVISHRNEVNELVDTNPNTRVDYLELISDAAGVWSQLVAAQRAANDMEMAQS